MPLICITDSLELVSDRITFCSFVHGIVVDPSAFFYFNGINKIVHTASMRTHYILFKFHCINRTAGFGQPAEVFAELLKLTV